MLPSRWLEKQGRKGGSCSVLKEMVKGEQAGGFGKATPGSSVGW